MRKTKQNQLKEKGWKIGSAEDFLELKLRLSDSLRQRRALSCLSQKEVAALIKSSQSRVAKMEGGDPSVSLDLLVKTLLAMGASDQDLANVIAARAR